MFLIRHKKLLPKKLMKWVALTSLISQNQLLKFKRGYKKLLVFSKITPLILVAFYFSGYQPILAIPPIKQSVVLAQFSQDQKIDPGSLSESFSLPHPGYLTTSFSTWHPGVDIAVGLGMPIHPILKGKVVEVYYGFFGYGNRVDVEHEQGYKSTYSHMGKIYVRKGDEVTKSSILGEIGLTGHTTGPHTHLEITKDDKPIDPVNILPSIPDWNTYNKQASLH